jgi:hypothetical protein
MKKILATVLIATLALSVLALPANAGKKKKVHETFGANLAPFPNLSSSTGTSRPGCSAGQEGVNWVGVEFKSPGKGTLRFWMEGFTGDHDIYILDGDIPIGRGDQAQVPDMAPPEEEIQLPLTKGQTVLLVACNWFGEPDVLAHYEGTFK